MVLVLVRQFSKNEFYIFHNDRYFSKYSREWEIYDGPRESFYSSVEEAIKDFASIDGRISKINKEYIIYKTLGIIKSISLLSADFEILYLNKEFKWVEDTCSFVTLAEAEHYLKQNKVIEKKHVVDLEI